MALPVIADVVRCAVSGVGAAGTNWVNVLHYKKLGTDSYPVAIAVAQGLIADFYTNGGGVGSLYGWGNFAVDDASVRRMVHTPLDGVSASTVVDVTIPGTGATEPLPPDTAVVISWRTAVRGPQARGRTYWAGMSEALNDSNGRLLAASQAQMITGANDFLAAMDTSNVPLVVASYKYAVYNEVVSATIDNVFDRQRRRKA